MWDSVSHWHALKWASYQLIGLGTLLATGWLFWTRQPYRWLLTAALVGSSLPYVLTHVDLRYRYPVFALSALLACDICMRFAQTLLGRLRISWRWNSGVWLPRLVYDRPLRVPEPAPLSP
jgi:hypothetical protein